MNLVYSATGKCIYPTRLRQIIETERSTHLSAEQQAFVSEDQKHTSSVARLKYKKLRSRDVVAKGKEALATIGKTSTLSLSPSENSVSEHNSTTTTIIKTEEADAAKRSPPRQGHIACPVYQAQNSIHRHIFYALVRGLGRDGGFKGGLRSIVGESREKGQRSLCMSRVAS